MNTASLSTDNSSLYPKICEIKYNTKSKIFNYFDHFEADSDQENLYETSFYDLKDHVHVEKLKWRFPTNHENTTFLNEKLTIDSVIEVNKRGTYDVPSNSASSLNEQTSKYSVVKIHESFKYEPTFNQYKSSIPLLKKAYTVTSLKESNSKSSRHREKLPESTIPKIDLSKSEEKKNQRAHTQISRIPEHNEGRGFHRSSTYHPSVQDRTEERITHKTFYPSLQDRTEHRSLHKPSAVPNRLIEERGILKNYKQPDRAEGNNSKYYVKPEEKSNKRVYNSSYRIPDSNYDIEIDYQGSSVPYTYYPDTIDERGYSLSYEDFDDRTTQRDYSGKSDERVFQKDNGSAYEVVQNKISLTIPNPNKFQDEDDEETFINTHTTSIKFDEKITRRSFSNPNESNERVENYNIPQIMSKIGVKGSHDVTQGLYSIPQIISDKIEAQLSQRGFTAPKIPPINQLPVIPKEKTSYVHFVSNPYSISSKPKAEKKVISYPPVIRTKKVVQIEPVKVIPKVEIVEKEKKEFEETNEKRKEKVFEATNRSKKKDKKLKNKKKSKKKTFNQEVDSDDSEFEVEDQSSLEPTGFQAHRPQAAARQRRKINFRDRTDPIEEDNENEQEESEEHDFQDIKDEIEKIEEKVKQEQEEIKAEYKSNLNLLDIKIKPKPKKISPIVKPNIYNNKLDHSRPVSNRVVVTPEDEKNKKEFHLRPLQRPYRIPENEKLLGKTVEEFTLEDDWLLKWCILENYRNAACESAFSKFDYYGRGFLNGEPLIQAIESIAKLNNLQMTYLFSVLNLVNVDALIYGADIKLFTIICSLASRINHLDDDWFKNLLPQYDLFTIENKVFKVKNLWSYLVDQETKLIYINDVLIEFEAGGVTSKHVEYAKEKFSKKTYFDIIDYLTYIPLFVHIHDKIIRNPLIIKKDI